MVDGNNVACATAGFKGIWTTRDGVKAVVVALDHEHWLGVVQDPVNGLVPTEWNGNGDHVFGNRGLDLITRRREAAGQ